MVRGWNTQPSTYGTPVITAPRAKPPGPCAAVKTRMTSADTISQGSLPILRTVDAVCSQVHTRRSSSALLAAGDQRRVFGDPVGAGHLERGQAAAGHEAPAVRGALVGDLGAH